MLDKNLVEFILIILDPIEEQEKIKTLKVWRIPKSQNRVGNIFKKYLA